VVAVVVRREIAQELANQLGVNPRRMRNPVAATYQALSTNSKVVGLALG
jgi:hypothetical protein